MLTREVSYLSMAAGHAATAPIMGCRTLMLLVLTSLAAVHPVMNCITTNFPITLAANNQRNVMGYSQA